MAKVTRLASAPPYVAESVRLSHPWPQSIQKHRRLGISHTALGLGPQLGPRWDHSSRKVETQWKRGVLIDRRTRERQVDMRQTGRRETGRHKRDRWTRDRQVDTRQVDTRQTGRRERLRQTRDRQADVRQTGQHERDRRTRDRQPREQQGTNTSE